MPGQNYDPLNPVGQDEAARAFIEKNIPLGPTPGEQLDRVESVDLGSRLQEQVERDRELARSRFEKRALETVPVDDLGNPDPYHTGTHNVDPPVFINHVANLTMDDFSPQPPKEVSRRDNRHERPPTPPVDPLSGTPVYDPITHQTTVMPNVTGGPNAQERAYPQTYTPPTDPFAALELFEYHRPTEAQIDAITAVRDSMKETCRVILTQVPPSAERTLAIRALHRASMHANSAIVFDGRKLI